jgi:hypothetical protein
VLSGDGFLGIWTDPHQILPLLTTDLSCSSPSDCIELQNLQVKSFLLILLLVSQASLTLAQAYIGCFSTYVYAGYPHEGGPTFTSSSEVYFNAPDCAVTPLLPAHSLVGIDWIHGVDRSIAKPTDGLTRSSPVLRNAFARTRSQTTSTCSTAPVLTSVARAYAPPTNSTYVLPQL